MISASRPDAPPELDIQHRPAEHSGNAESAMAIARQGASAPLPRRAPTTLRETFELFARYKPEAGLEALFEGLDLAMVSPRQVYYAVHGRPPERLEFALRPAGFSPLRRFVAALGSQEFRARIIINLLDAFPERKRLLFVHIPRAAGSELSVRLMRRYPSVTSQLTWLDWVTPEQFYAAIREFVLEAGRSDSIFVRGHNTLDQYHGWRAIRFKDSVFAVLRDPVEMTVSQINYVLTRMFAQKPGPDSIAWRRRFGVETAMLQPSASEAAALARNILADKGVVTPNTICRYLGNGTAAHAIQNVVIHDVELTDFHHYEQWSRRRWGSDSRARENSSTGYVRLEDFSPAERTYIESLTEEDNKLYRAAQRAFAKRGGDSITGAEIL